MTVGDFFISYTQSDRAWAEWIAWQLEEERHRVLVQAWDFVAGTNWIRRMHDGVSQTERTIALLSHDYLSSVYGSAEWQAAWAADPAGTDRRLLTVRVTDCPRPGLLGGVVGIDVFDTNEAEAKARLRTMIAGVLVGRAKPHDQPMFPLATRAMTGEARFPGSLPTVWNVQARNPNFTGRVNDLAAIRDGFAAGMTMTVHSVRGMGGVGKTQLANEYAHRNATMYALIWWIAAEEPALIPDQFARLAERLGIDSTGDPESLAGAVHDALREVPGWLLIFDNADAVDHLRAWLPPGPFPPGVPGHVLITTRRGGFGALGHVRNLDVINGDEALQLMRARVPDLAADIGRRIAEEFGRLPLAVEQAAAYLDQTGIPPAEYLDLLKTHAEELHRRGKLANRNDTVATLWDLSLDRVAAEHPASAQLLDLCAYFAPEPIPTDLFTGHADELPEPLASAAKDPLAFNDTLAVAVDYSLAKRTPAGVQMHRMLQAALRARHHQDDASGK